VVITIVIWSRRHPVGRPLSALIILKMRLVLLSFHVALAFLPAVVRRVGRFGSSRLNVRPGSAADKPSPKAQQSPS